MRNQSWQSSCNTLFNLVNALLPCHCHFSGEGEQELWLWGWKDICFHLLDVSYTNKNLSNILSGLPLTLNTHAISWPIQFHQFGKEWLMMNYLLSPYFINIHLCILKCISVRNNIGFLEMTCQFLKSITLMLQGMWLQFSSIFNSFIRLNARCFLLLCGCFLSLGPIKAWNFKSSFLQFVILMLFKKWKLLFFPNLHSGSESRLLACSQKMQIMTANRKKS